jgi:hypothetical protein
MVTGEDQAVSHAVALAVFVATVTKVLIISTSVQMCEALGSKIQKEFQG